MSERGDFLIHRYLDGLASAAEEAEFGRLLAADARVADAFARATRMDAALEELFVDGRDRRSAAAIVDAVAEPQAPAVPVRWSLRWVAAAALLLALGTGILYLMRNRQQPPVTLAANPVYAVAAGRVLVDGVEDGQIHDGAEVEVVGDQAAVILLADGARAELAPATKAVIRHGRVIELNEGSGQFQVAEAAGRLHVETPVGKVSAAGTEFAVELEPWEREATDEPMSQQVAMALIVGVLSGNVDVHYGDRHYPLGIGENRVYAANKPPAGRKNPDIIGQVAMVSDGGRAITLELPDGKRGRTNKRLLYLTDETRLAYVNVPWRRDRPTPGYQASVWLADGSTDTAAAVTFKGNKSSAPAPSLSGRVSGVSADGKEITLELAPPKKGKPAAKATIKIVEKTRATYALVPFFAEKPTVGYHVSVWLADGSKDTAAAVAFSGKKGSAPMPDVTGTVTAVSADGKEVTLQLPSRTKGQPGAKTTIKITNETKVSYPGVKGGRPAPGLTASVWLAKNSSDTAAGIQFIDLRAARKPDSAKTPAKKGDSGLSAFFAVPRVIELTPEQQPKVTAIIHELEPQYKDYLRRKEAVLTPDQKLALAVATRAAREAGLTDKRQIQEALDAAANITQEQKERMQAFVREEKDLRKRFLDKLTTILTDEQKAKLAKPKPVGKASAKPKVS
jgi:ferric-dicitrate binding protein FerR (iron transport regulator)